MKRESYCEIERQKRMHAFCNYKRQFFDKDRLRRMISMLLADDMDALKEEMRQMYTRWNLSRDEHVIRNMRITEWIIDVYIDLMSKGDRRYAVSSMILYINKELRRYDDLGFGSETRLLHDIVLLFTHELGRMKRESKSARVAKEYVSDDDVINEKRALNIF